MAKLSTMAGATEQRVCLYGPPKSGKTELVGRLAEHYKILFFDLENGSSTLLKLPKELQERIEVIKIRDSRVYPIAIETMMKVVKGDRVEICEAHSKVKCPVCSKNPSAVVDVVCLNDVALDTVVVIDSLTQLTNSGIAHITKSQPDDYKLQLDDWGALKVLMDKFLSQIQVARYHVICITHEEEVKFEDGRAKIVPVAGSANSSRNTAKYFDHVCYCNLVNKKHTVASATDYSMTVLTGSRMNVKLESSPESTLLDIFTNWKLPNFGMKTGETQNETLDDKSNVVRDSGSDSTGSSGSDAASIISTIPVNSAADKPLSPQQIALANLRSKQAGLKTAPK